MSTISASASIFFILSALPWTAFGGVDFLQAPDPVSRLEDRLRSTYLALPRDGEGLPDSSGVRYLARRYLEVEHGWTVKGLDMVPWLRDGRNASQSAGLRASELLAGGGELPTSGPLLAVLSPEPRRGFTLREAAEVVLALEEFVASHDAALIGRAIALSKMPGFFRDGARTLSDGEVALWFYAMLLHTSDADVLRGQLEPAIVLRVMQELNQRSLGLAADAGVPLRFIVAEAAQKAIDKQADAELQHPGASMTATGMRHIRKRLHERHTRGWCQRLRGVLSSMDHEGSGQVEFRHVFATTVNNWRFTETPEYLSAVGALAEKRVKGGSPGVLIPNYVSGMNSCESPTEHPAMSCCPDECEADIMPRLEAAAAGPRIAPKKVWAALSHLIKRDKLATAEKRKELRSRLRALGLRSRDGLVEVHGRRLGRWLHRAFPHKCRGPAARGSPALVDPTLSRQAWVNDGKFQPTAAEDIEVIRAHLQARWGPDGTGADPHCFAARSTMSLDEELQLVHKLHDQQKSGGPPVQQALENALNVRVLDSSSHAEHILATILAIALLGPLAAAVALMGGDTVKVCSFLAAAAALAGRLSSARPVAPRAQECRERGVGVALGREGPCWACEAGPAVTEKDESTDSGDTESVSPASEYSEAARELCAEDSDSERETVKASAEADRGCVDASDAFPIQTEVSPDVATKADKEEADPQEAPAAGEVMPLAEAAGARQLPRQATFPKGFWPPPGLEPPPGLQLIFEAVGLEPDLHRPHQEQSPPSVELTVHERTSVEEHSPAPPHECNVPYPHRLTQQA